MMQDYYLILELKQNATLDQIKQAYKCLAKIYHPDTLTGLTEAQRAHFTEKFKKINEAYTVLSDLTQKATYDAKLNKLEVAPSSIDFGIVDKGNKVIRTFSINHLGTPSKINISCPETWCTVTSIKSLSGNTTFPLSVEVTAETENLSPQKHAGRIDIDIDGLKSTVSLSISVRQVKPHSPPKSENVFTLLDAFAPVIDAITRDILDATTRSQAGRAARRVRHKAIIDEWAQFFNFFRWVMLLMGTLLVLFLLAVAV